jgi:hypothetical protein
MFDVRESWTDERLDDFRGEVNRRFDSVDRRFDKVDTELARVNDRLDGLHRLLIFTVLSLMSATFAGYAAMIALIVTQL